MYVDKETKREIDRRDFNDEMAGRETGRQERFTSGRSDHAQTERKREKEATESQLRMLLRDAEYARLYERAWDALNSTQAALDEEMLRNEEATARLSGLVDTMESRAATLPSGEKVFRSKDGNLYTADGRQLSDNEAVGIETPEDATDYDAYLQAKEALKKAQARGAKLAGIQTDVIDPARGRLIDEDNPPSPDELRGMTKKLREVEAEIEVSAASSFEAAAAPPVGSVDELPLSLAEIPSALKLR